MSRLIRHEEFFSGGRGGAAPFIPSQTFGAELLTNPDLDWAAGALTGWTLTGTTVGGDPGISEVAPDGGAGIGAVRMVSSATANRPNIKQTVLTLGDYYEIAATMSAWTSGACDFIAGSSGSILAPGTALAVRNVVRSSGVDLTLSGRGVAPHDFVLSDASVKKLTVNAQLTAPSADMDVSFLYTLPGTPKRDDSVWLIGRISDFSAGNYWLAHLIYTGTQWNVNLYAVASHARGAALKSATNIGTTNGIRFYANGTTIRMYTTADGGNNWTQRGTDLTNATYQSSTGYNVMAGSQFTLGQLAAA